MTCTCKGILHMYKIFGCKRVNIRGVQNDCYLFVKLFLFYLCRAMSDHKVDSNAGSLINSRMSGCIPHFCPECGLKSMSSNDLQSHMDTHRTAAESLSNMDSDGRNSMVDPIAVLLVNAGNECLPEDSNDSTCTKPFGCDHCGKTFASKSRIESHILRSHEKPRFSCGECGQQFNSAIGLRRHKMTDHANIYPYSCNLCSDKFMQAKCLKRHRLMHWKSSSSDKPYLCPFCVKRCTSKVGLTKHLKYGCSASDASFSGQLYSSHSCKDCGKKFQRMYNLKRHAMARHSVSTKPYLCPFCGQRFMSDKKLEKHIHSRCSCSASDDCCSVELYSSHSCKDCGKNFKQIYLKRHIMARHSDLGKQYSCPECSKPFKSETGLSLHMNIHNGTKFLCPECGKQFNFSDNLRLHMMNHNGIKPYSCNHCGKKFKTSSHLKEHVVRMHSDSRDEPHGCAVCVKYFSSSRSLSVHMRQHMPGFSCYSCPQCNRTFKREVGLRNHMIDHTGVYPYECHKCGKRFKQVSSLRVHTANRHGGSEKKPYMCPDCFKFFPSKLCLLNHMNIHGEPKFLCTGCGEKFYTAVNFNRHMCTKPYQPKSSHTLHMDLHHEPRFACTECGKKFSYADGLKKHLFSHTGLKPHSCAQCGQKFVSVYTLRRHERHFKGQCTLLITSS